MQIFSKTTEKNGYTIIVGCGRLGATLANALSNQDGAVLIIDKEQEAFLKLDNSYGGQTLLGDGMALESLTAAGIKQATTVLAVTDNDNVNILVAQLAKEMFKVKKVIARLYDPERQCIYKDMGIATVCPAQLSAAAITALLAARKEDE